MSLLVYVKQTWLFLCWHWVCRLLQGQVTLFVCRQHLTADNSLYIFASLSLSLSLTNYRGMIKVIVGVETTLY